MIKELTVLITVVIYTTDGYHNSHSDVIFCAFTQFVVRHPTAMHPSFFEVALMYLSFFVAIHIGSSWASLRAPEEKRKEDREREGMDGFLQSHEMVGDVSIMPRP